MEYFNFHNLQHVEVVVKLKRLSDNAVSEPKTFTFLPENPGKFSSRLIH